MHSQSNHSEVAQEDPSPLFASLSGNNNKYIKFNEIKKYQAQKIPTNPNAHQNCKPLYIRWAKENPSDPASALIKKNNKSEYIVQHNLSLCCLHLKLVLIFSLKKRSKIEILKLKKSNNSYTQDGIKFTIEYAQATIKIQVSITKQGITKIWKQMQVPLRSHELEALYTLTLQQTPSGQIAINLNDFQFLVSVALSQIAQNFLVIRSYENLIHRIQFQQTKMKEIEKSSGCDEENCNIF